MSKWHDFLVEHARFPFLHPDELRSTGTTDVSELEAVLLKREWKAKYAVRDNTLVHKLCDTLEKILGDTTLPADSKNNLLTRFSPKLQFDEGGIEDPVWETNTSEATVSSLYLDSRLNNSS
jgi:hypothetical protein